jgi:hypothetical protein
MSILQVKWDDALANTVVLPWIEQEIHNMMPEEVVILSKILGHLKAKPAAENIVSSIVKLIESQYVSFFVEKD